MIALSVVRTANTQEEMQEPAMTDSIKIIASLFDGDFDYARQISNGIREELIAFGEDNYSLKFLPEQSAGWDSQKAEYGPHDLAFQTASGSWPSRTILRSAGRCNFLRIFAR